jgi:octaprenyl-diphosphate synthase
MMRRMAEAASEVCSGEIIQTQRRFDLNLSVPDYYRIIEMKTGALFAVATELGAFLNEATPSVIAAMRTFGLKFGTAFQIYDDVLDLAGDEANAGKTLGSDLRKGKLTLPILYLLQHSESADRARICEIILGGSDEEIAMLVRKAIETGAVNNAVVTGRRMLRETEVQLKVVPANKYHDALKSLIGTLDGMLGQFAE